MDLCVFVKYKWHRIRSTEKISRLGVYTIMPALSDDYWQVEPVLIVFQGSIERISLPRSDSLI